MTACASNPPALTTRVERVEVPLITVQRCVRAADIPVAPTLPPIAANADLLQRKAWLELWILKWREYALTLHAMLEACTTSEVQP